MKRKTNRQPSRREILGILAGLGITGPAALELAAQAKKNLSSEILKSANTLVDQSFDDERLKIISAALQRNLDQFQMVRDLEIDDLVEPVPMFAAKVR